MLKRLRYVPLARIVHFPQCETIRYASEGSNKMKREIATVPVEREASVEARLWNAVLASTLQEWTSGPLRRRREAEEYLFNDNTDFPLVCQSAGIDVGRLRSKLGKLRGRAKHIDHPLAA